MFKKVFIAVVCLVIAMSLVGCDITPTLIETVASQAGFLVSQDGTDYFGHLFYAGRYWYLHFNTVSEMLKYGNTTWSEVNNIKNTMVVAGYRITSWAMLSPVIRNILIVNLSEALPLYPLYQAPMFMFPIIPGMPQLIATEQPM